MFLIRTLLSQGTILCIVLLLVTLDVGFSTAKATTKPGKLLLVLAGCLVLFGGMELLRLLLRELPPSELLPVPVLLRELLLLRLRPSLQRLHHKLRHLR